MTIPVFRRLVWKHYETRGRHDLPWRQTQDAYRILVSEIMLQQTQVGRVKGFYARFLKRFPTAKKLAAAPLGEVLVLWQGLGYNRRGKMLHEAAKAVVRDFKGKMPTDPTELEKLPGVGPYTARAVAAFAGNKDVVFVETNLRTAVIHHFFPDQEKVTDAEVLSILEKALPKGKAREWYSALMDYGASLKRSGVRVNAKARGYAKQKKFEGSGRQVRGAILRALSGGPKSEKSLINLFGPERREESRALLGKLLEEGMLLRSGRSFRLPD